MTKTTRRTPQGEKLPLCPDEDRKDRITCLPIRTPGPRCDDPSLCVWRWPGNGAPCSRILPVRGGNQTGAAVHDAHAPRFRSGSEGLYQGSLPHSMVHAETAARITSVTSA